MAEVVRTEAGAADRVQTSGTQLLARPVPVLAGIVLLAVVLRVGVAVYLGSAMEETRGGTYDQVSYDMLAQRVAGGHGFTFPRDWWPYVRANQPTAFWSYLYTGFLAGVYGVVGHYPVLARLLQAAVVGLLTPWLTYRIGRRAFGRQVGLVAAGIAAVYLYFVHYAASLMTEAFYIVGILWCVDVAMRMAAEASVEGGDASNSRPKGSLLRLGLELGLAMTLTLLLRQVILVFFGVLVVWLLWVGWRAGRLGPVLLAVLVAGMLSAALLLPWVARNYRVFGRWTMPNTNAGFAFFWANHPVYGARFEAVLSPEHGVSYQDLIPPELRELNEASLDSALLARGLGFVRADPGRYLLLSLSRIPVYFQFWPMAESTLLSNLARVFSFGLFLPFMVYGLFLALKRLARAYRRRTASTRPAQTASGREGQQPDLHFEFVMLLLLFIVVYALIHLASWANVRYRLPVDAVLILFAGYALVDLLDKVSGLVGIPARRRAGSDGFDPTVTGIGRAE